MLTRCKNHTIPTFVLYLFFYRRGHQKFAESDSCQILTINLQRNNTSVSQNASEPVLWLVYHITAICQRYQSAMAINMKATAIETTLKRLKVKLFITSKQKYPVNF